MLRSLSCATLAWALLMSASAFAKPVDLTILHTNDTHDHLVPFNSPYGQDVGGIARRATLFKQVKAHTPNVLVLDAGDAFQGTPVFTFFKGAADYEAMGEDGYDATTVGNHDLDDGLANLQLQARHLGFPIISCNLVNAQGRSIFPRYEIIKRGGLKIAITGVIGHDAYYCIADNERGGVYLKDPTVTLKQLVPELRKQADLVVVLSHSGHQEELQMAKDIPGIDVIVGGHSHTKVDHPVAVRNGSRTTLVVQAYQWGEFVGRIDLKIDHDKIISYDGHLIQITRSLKDDPKVAATVASFTRKLEARMDKVVAYSDAAFSGEGMRKKDVPLGDLVADAMREETKTDIALMNTGGIRSNLPKGPLTTGMVYSMLPFPNALVTIKANGTIVRRIVDALVARSKREGLAMQVSGLSFDAEGGKTQSVLVNGKALDPNKIYSISTIDYVAAGNDGWDVFKEVHSTPTGLLLRDAFFDYLKAHPTLEAPTGGRIQLQP